MYVCMYANLYKENCIKKRNQGVIKCNIYSLANCLFVYYVEKY